MPNFIPTQKEYKNNPTFKLWVANNFPFIEEDFDGLTNYQLMCKVVEHLNTNIENMNTVEENTEALYTAFSNLNNYVSSYFNNLDVQEEINTKLDNMAQDGSLTNLIKGYVDPLYSAYETRIDNKIEQLEDDFSVVQDEVSSVTSGSPAGVYPTIAALQQADPDHSKIYVVSEDGEWYFWNNTTNQWKNGGVYQSSVEPSVYDYIATLNSGNSIQYGLFNPLDVKDNMSFNGNTGAETSSSNFWITGYIEIPSSTVLPRTNDVNFKLQMFFNQMGYETNSITAFWYDADKVYDHYTDVPNTRGYFNLQNMKETIKYVRFRFKKSSIPFTNRFNIKMYLDYISNDSKFIPYYNISKENIVNGSIATNHLDESIKYGVVYQNIKLGTYKLTPRELGYGATRNVERDYNINTKRIMTDILFLSKGATIHLEDNSKFSFRITHINDDGSVGDLVSQEWVTNQVVPADDKYVINFRIIVDSVEVSVTPEYVAELCEEVSFSYTEDVSNVVKYEGEKISLENEYIYSNFGITNQAQDMCIYNDKLLTFTTTGKFAITDLTTKERSANYDMEILDNNIPHCNSACFGTQFYDDTDEFPLFYVNSYSHGAPQGVCYVYRIVAIDDGYYADCVQKIEIGFINDDLWKTTPVDDRPYGNFVVDTDKNRLIVYNEREVEKKTRFFIFNLPDKTIEHAILNINDILKYFDVPFLPYIQGGCYYQGKVFSLSGLTTADGKCVVVNLDSEKIVSSFSTARFFEEPEGIDVYNKKLLIAPGYASIRELDFK